MLNNNGNRDSRVRVFALVINRAPDNILYSHSVLLNTISPHCIQCKQNSAVDTVAKIYDVLLPNSNTQIYTHDMMYLSMAPSRYRAIKPSTVDS